MELIDVDGFFQLLRSRLCGSHGAAAARGGVGGVRDGELLWYAFYGGALRWQETVAAPRQETLKKEEKRGSGPSGRERRESILGCKVYSILIGNIFLLQQM